VNQTARPANSLHNAVMGLRAPMIEFTRQLIAIPTENPPGDCYSQAKELILKQLKQLGFEDTRVIGDCILSLVGSGARTLYFSGHYDVVPAQSAAQFEPRIQGENLFGRGSSDMKSGLAAMAYAAKALVESSVPLNGRIGLVFVPDEETSGPRGSRYLLEQGMLGENAVGMLTPEPTTGVIWNASRGAITLKITVKGKPAHVGRQHEGVNAFEQMLVVVEALQDLKKEVEAHRTAFHIAPEAARHSILMIGGRAESGTNFNVVPDRAWFTVERRINPEERLEEQKQRLLAVLDKVRARGIDLEIEVLQEGEACGVEAGSQLEQALTKSIQEVTGRAPQIEMCPGLLEIRYYAATRIPAFAYGPGLLTVSHGPNEFVPMERIVQCSAIYALTAAEILAVAAEARSAKSR
jgi:succinyl-diaminopimelate desuccinylase